MSFGIDPLGALIGLLFTVVISYILCALARRLSNRVAFVDNPGGRKQHSRPIPLGGGVAIFLSMVIAFGVLLLVRVPSYIFELGFDLPVVMLCMLAVVGIGLWDDIRPVGPWVKLGLQLAVGAALFFAGVKITVFVYSPVLNFAVTVVWVTLIMNAFNLLDSSDGLSASVATVISVMIVTVLALTIGDFPATLFILLAGALLGFLLHNFPPARLFMGDAGSLFTGFVLALGSILVTFYNPNWGYDPLLAMMAPALIFSVPIYDTLSVMLIRMRLRKPLFVGDRNHLPHRLQALGLSSRESLLVITLLTLATSAAAVYVTSLTRFQALVVLFQTLAMFIILFILETAGERRR